MLDFLSSWRKRGSSRTSTVKLLCFFIIFIMEKVQFSDSIKAINELSDLTSKEFYDLIDRKAVEKDPKVKLLSRKRRYLIFPEGSSVQLVYDQIVPIVDYTNQFILGITVAFAWELPSKAPSEQIDEIKTKLEDGTLGFERKDENFKDFKYIDKNFDQSINRKYSWNNNENSKFSAYSGKYGNDYYYRPSVVHMPFSRPLSSSASKYYFNSNGGQNYWASNLDRQSPYLKPNDSSWTSQRRIDPWSRDREYPNSRMKFSEKNPSSQRRTNKVLPAKPYRKHRIYPVFGKRSIDDREIPEQLTLEEKLHLKYHRSSRHDLYDKIEKYLSLQGKNGETCVLKALCETGQRRSNNNREEQNENNNHNEHAEEPGSFVGEIMRTIFSMPRADNSEEVGVSRGQTYMNHRHRRYDDAHGYKGSCTERYPLCPESLWTADFIF